jgi:hypothetical protein
MFPDSTNLIFLDGAVLHTMGFPLQVSYRYRKVLERDASDSKACLTLGATLFELGRQEQGIR